MGILIFEGKFTMVKTVQSGADAKGQLCFLVSSTKVRADNEAKIYETGPLPVADHGNRLMDSFYDKGAK